MTTLVITHPVAEYDAWKFLGDPSLRAAMSRAGVVGDPRIELWDTVQTATF